MRSPEDTIETLCEQIAYTVREGVVGDDCCFTALSEAKLRVQLREFAKAIVEECRARK